MTRAERLARCRAIRARLEARASATSAPAISRAVLTFNAHAPEDLAWAVETIEGLVQATPRKEGVI